MRYLKTYKLFEFNLNLKVAPYGVIKFNDKKFLVGDMHQKPLEISDDLISDILRVANEYGYYGEGIGLEYNEAITKSSFYDKLDPDKYMGSWDKKLIESGKVPKDKEYVFLYSLFSNPKENKRLEKILEYTEEGDIIFDVLLKTIPYWSAEMGIFNLGEIELNKFLSEISESDIDFVEMSKQESNEKTLSEFLDIGEYLQWPENWEEYPNMAGKFARIATTIRDLFLINSASGVYFVGAGHLPNIVRMSEDEELNLELIGGEDIYLNKIKETIKVPIKVGDTVLGGRFKNKKTVVKKIGKNDKGDITINGKPLLKYRIIKESNSYDRLQEDVESYLAHLKDDFKIEVAGSQLIGNPIRNNYYIRIWKQKDTNKPYTFNNCVGFTWSEIEEEVLRFISIIEENWSIDYLYGISQLNSSDWYNGNQSHEHRTMFTKNELSNLNGNSELKSFVIGLVKDVSKLDESTVSTFSQDIKSLLPENLNLITTNGQFELELKDVMLNGDLIQIVYYQNTFEKSGDALGDGEPDYLGIDIHTLKDNDGTKANPDTLRLNIDITYGDSMMFSFTIDKDNGLNVHHYDGINSKYDPESTFHFSDDTIKDLVELFNRFDDYQLTPKDFTFLDSDPNSYQPNL